MSNTTNKQTNRRTKMRLAVGAMLAISGTVLALILLLLPAARAPREDAARPPHTEPDLEPTATAPQIGENGAAEPARIQEAEAEPPAETGTLPAYDHPTDWEPPRATGQLLGTLDAAGPPSDAVRSITGAGPDRDNQKARRAAINELTVNLAGDDAAALIEFLLVPHDEDSGVSRTIYNVLRNDVLEVLVRQDTMPDGLGGLMVAMLRNPEEDSVWRDYSMQYMAEYYRRRWSPESDIESDPDGLDERLQMLDAFRDAFNQTEDTLAGTALIGFETLARHYPEIDAAEAAASALRIAGEQQMSAASRLTALRICATLGEQQALPTARRLAQIGETAPLRMAAIATLGDLGSTDDLPLLDALSGAAEPGIARIATEARTRLAEKLAQNQQDQS